MNFENESRVPSDFLALILMRTIAKDALAIYDKNHRSRITRSSCEFREIARRGDNIDLED